MNLKKELAEIEELYGKGWFEEVIENCPEIAKLPLEERIRAVRRSSLNTQTHFYRDNLSFKVLETLILPSYPPERNISIASVGCSEGREPFSVLLQNWDKRDNVIIEAYDSNPRVIEKAKLGEYKSSFGDSEYDWIRNLDIGTPNEAYEAIKERLNLITIKFTEEAKNCINFKVLDITRESLPRKYDLVLLMNILMHYTPKGRERILLNIYDSMEEDAWLVCETSPPCSEYKEYAKWMQDIERFRFEKQKTILPQWFNENSDVTWLTQVYRKVSL